MWCECMLHILLAESNTAIIMSGNVTEAHLGRAEHCMGKQNLSVDDIRLVKPW